jgi:hypothetical protein
MAGVIVYAMHGKGRVRANFSFLGTAFSLEVEEKQKSLCAHYLRSADVRLYPASERGRNTTNGI